MSPTLTDRALALSVRAIARMPAFVQIGLSGGRRTVVDGQKLDPQLQLIVAFRKRLNPAPLKDLNATHARARFRSDMRTYAPGRTAVGAIRDFTIPGAATELNVRHYAPPHPENAPLLVYYHGGGFVIGDLDTHEEPCRMICRYANTHVLSVEYRLAPEHRYPAAVDDGLAAFNWAHDNASALGADPACVSVGGDSAGGAIAAIVSLRTRDAARRPTAQLLIYPAADRNTARPSQQLFDKQFLLSMDDRSWYYDHYLAGSHDYDTHPHVSPIYAEALSDLPRALVITAGYDVLRDEGEAYAAALQLAGTQVALRRFESLAHGFINITPICPAAERAFRDVIELWGAVQ